MPLPYKDLILSGRSFSMNKKLLYTLWGGLFSLCAGLGFIPEPGGILSGIMTGLSLASFLPPAVLLYQAAKNCDRDTLALIRGLSALSLGLTLVLLIVNFLAAVSSEVLGTILYYTLVIVSSPMICSGHWALSMFLWACLLIAAAREWKKA